MKITLVGGGGSRAPLFVQAIAGRGASPRVDRLTLFDSDPDRLRTLGGLAAAVASRRGARFQVELTSSLDAAIDGASFVVTSIRAGGDAARARYERIARDVGVIGQETVGAGGFALATWNGPALLDLARRVELRASTAHVLHFTNPAGLVAQLLLDAGFRRHVGICDTPSDLVRRTARHLRRDPRSLRPTVVGLNHLSWLQRLEDVEGTDHLPALLRDDAFMHSVGQPFEPELVRGLGLLPTEYLHYYYHRDVVLARQSGRPRTRGEYLDRRGWELRAELDGIDTTGRYETAFDRALDAYERYCADRDGSYREELGRDDPAHSAEDAGEGYAGVALDLMAAIGGERDELAIASVPSSGAVPGFAADDVVETTVRVHEGAIEPQASSPLPPDAAGLMHAVKAYERLAARAVLERDRALAARALTSHPLVGSYRLAGQLVTAFLETHDDPRGPWR